MEAGSLLNLALHAGFMLRIGRSDMSRSLDINDIKFISALQSAAMMRFPGSSQCCVRNAIDRSALFAGAMTRQGFMLRRARAPDSPTAGRVANPHPPVSRPFQTS